MSGSEESFISHLIELRSRLMKAALVVIVVFLCLMPWAGTIYDYLALPMMQSLPQGSKMIATGVITPFLIPVKVTMLVAFIIALPWVLYQMWAFVAPGLYAHEKKLIAPLVISSSMLFIAFGLTFEVPVVVIVLVRMGLVSVEKLRQMRPYVIVGAFVVAAVVTPPDVMSQMLLAVPLCLLFEIGLLLAPMFARITRAPAESESL
ncbi:MAG TPA: twin-arginine translocase subunit TatC [Oxalicibacterium sp.]|nr:twin-arginine translocase subunit TatC [Oxalicibacterium sp.]